MNEVKPVTIRGAVEPSSFMLTKPSSNVFTDRGVLVVPGPDSGMQRPQEDQAVTVAEDNIPAPFTVQLAEADAEGAMMAAAEPEAIQRDLVAMSMNILLKQTTELRLKPEEVKKYLMEIAGNVSAARDFQSLETVAMLGLALDHKDPDFHLQAGIAFRGLDQQDAARIAFETALELAPGAPVALANLGSLLIDMEDEHNAKRHLLECMKLSPGFAYGVQNYMIALLTYGPLPEAWRLFSRRLQFEKIAVNVSAYDVKAWNGKGAQRVLVCGEEGYGERIMFASMLPDLIAAGATPVLEINGPFQKFLPFFARSFPQCEIVKTGDTLHVDSQVIIGDLAAHFRPDFDSFPKHNGYMKADRALTLQYRKRVAPGPVVGLSWHSIGPAGPKKSVPLKFLAAVPAMHQRLTWLDLQYGNTAEDRVKYAPLLHHFFDADFYNEPETQIAAVAACDLVITISSITAHIAGALGVPCWLLLPRGAGSMWFWFRGRTDSPWYPSVKIYRESERGWGPTIGQINSDLLNNRWSQWNVDLRT